jgi:hypothetical protein
MRKEWHTKPYVFWQIFSTCWLKWSNLASRPVFKK